MGQCCGRSQERFKGTSAKICEHIQSLHVSAAAHEPSTNGTSLLNNGCHNNHSNYTRQVSNYSSSGGSGGGGGGGIVSIMNPLRSIVSKKRNRYKADGFDLDLTYIEPNIIAMGYPACNIESVYRNHIDDVVDLLDKKHPDRYWIYNLCSERGYDKSKFHNRVQSFPFDDHNPPKIELIQPFCESVHRWLSQHRDNVAVVHCKAGKGRTGTMICCYLLYGGIKPTADAALGHYAQRRTQDLKGVTIPSQVRYVKYFEYLVRNNLTYAPLPVYINEFALRPLPNLEGHMWFTISQQTPEVALTTHHQQHHHGNNSGRTLKNGRIYKSCPYEIRRGAAELSMKLDFCLPLTGDVRVEFFHKSKIGRKERHVQFWFNTYFVVQQDGYYNQNGGDADGGLCGGGSGSSCEGAAVELQQQQTYAVVLKKDELDVVMKKDKQHKMYSADLQVTTLMKMVPRNGSDALWTSYTRKIPRIAQDTPSESSEAESSEVDSNEDGWESGESTYL